MNYTLLETPNYEQWFMKLHDPIAKKAMVARLRRIEIYGYFGDCKAVGDGVYELRIHTALRLLAVLLYCLRRCVLYASKSSSAIFMAK